MGIVVSCGEKCVCVFYLCGCEVGVWRECVGGGSGGVHVCVGEWGQV